MCVCVCVGVAVGRCGWVGVWVCGGTKCVRITQNARDLVGLQPDIAFQVITR